MGVGGGALPSTRQFLLIMNESTDPAPTHFLARHWGNEHAIGARLVAACGAIMLLRCNTEGVQGLLSA